MKPFRWMLASLQLFIGLPALVAGYAFIREPSGLSLGLRSEWLAAAPFKTYLLPGLCLLLVLGLGHAWAAGLSLARKPWAGPVGLGLGAFLVAWILLQRAWLEPQSPFQIIMLAAGMAELWLAWHMTGRAA